MLLSVLYLALITGLGSVNHPAPGHSSHCHWSLHWSTPLISDHSRPSSTLQTLCVLWQLKFLKFVNIRRNVTVWLFMTLFCSHIVVSWWLWSVAAPVSSVHSSVPLSICKWCQTILVTQPHNKDIVDRIHHMLTLQARTICCHLCLHLPVQILHTTLQANIYNLSLIGLHSPQFLFEMIIDDWRTRDMALERGHRVSEYPSSHSLILHINNFLWPVQYLSNVNV